MYKRFLQNLISKSRVTCKFHASKKREGGCPEAISVLIEGIRKNGNSVKLYFELGQLYDRTGNYTSAAEAYVEYSNLTPQKIDAFNLAGDAYKNAGEYKAASKLYREVLALDPQNMHALEALAVMGAISRYRDANHSSGKAFGCDS